MAFRKKCHICGKEYIYESRRDAPRKCEGCGVDLSEVSAQEFFEQTAEAPEEMLQPVDNRVSETTPETKNNKLYFRFMPTDGDAGFDVRDTPCIIGRLGVGADSLEPYLQISREHLKVTEMNVRGIRVEDISQFGTSLNGERVKKNSAILVRNGDIVTLCNRDFTVTRRYTKNDDE